MTKESFEVRGRTVRAEAADDSSQIHVTVDDQDMLVAYDTDSDRYSTALMPYRDYGSLRELVESVYENHPDFREARRGSSSDDQEG